MKKFIAILVLISLTFGCGGGNAAPQGPLGSVRAIPPEALNVINKEIYKDSTWALRAVDTATGDVLYDLNSNQPLLIGSVRKLYSVGAALCSLGSDHTFVTDVHRQGTVDNSGVLSGNLVLIASGDVTMGGRRQADGTMALGAIDHNEANTIGNAQLTNTDPLTAYKELAAGVAASGITEIQGDVIIDDRLFQPFEYRDEFFATPAYVNEDLVDVSMSPSTVGQPANVDWRPKSAAFTVVSTLNTVAGDGDIDVTLNPIEPPPECFSMPNCQGQVTGEMPVDSSAPIFGAFPYVQNFRITAPSVYARTVFIEALEAEGVAVQAATVGLNPTNLLPPSTDFTDQTRVTRYTSLPYSQYARLILKVSFNLGADTTLMMVGVAQGVNNLTAALTQESQILESELGISPSEYTFLDGSGGGDTLATSTATVDLLQAMSRKAAFQDFFDALPILGTDGTLIPVNQFLQDPTLAGAAAGVHAKTGTFIKLADDNVRVTVVSRAMAGYIDTKSGRRISFSLVVNNGGVFDTFGETSVVNQDLGTITAILWRDTF